MAVTGLTICQDALTEIGALGAGETASAEDADLALSKLNRLFDNWNAERQAVFADQLITGTLNASQQPHTIGPTGDFVATVRPVSIDAANLILTNGVRVPITLRDAAWWIDQSVPTIASTIPSDLYYNPTWPAGELNFWPVPSTAYDVELLTRIVLAALSLATTFTLPPGYRDAITLTLAESLVSPFGAASRVAPTLVNDASKARARVFGNNVRPPRLATRDAGMPGGGPSVLNYLTRR